MEIRRPAGGRSRAAVLILTGLAPPAASAAPGPAAHQPRSRTAASAAAWAIQPTPNPLIREGLLTAVSCTSPGACMAVGQRRDRTGAFVTLAERWNGATWSVLKTPSPAGASTAELVGVSCTSATFCIAVGTTITSALAEAWNGTAWSVQKTPVPKLGGQLSGVSCTTASACTAAGYDVVALAEAWNGTSWSVQQTPLRHTRVDHTLDSVSCTSATACTAVGHVGGETLAERWNGPLVPPADPARRPWA